MSARQLLTPLKDTEYQVMPFELVNAPDVFQVLINDLLRDMLDKFVFVHLNDILIFSRCSQEHVRIILSQLLKNGLFVKLEKNEFHVPTVSFFGFIVSSGNVQMDSGKIQAVLNWPQPFSAIEVQHFLGFADFYRRFIRNFSTIAEPLTALTKEASSPFNWNERASHAFDRLKQLFTSTPILTLSDPELPFVVEVDALGIGVGAVLSQRARSDHKLHPCSYFSRQLSPADRNYDIGNQELLAVKLALEEWRPWLEGAKHPFLIWKDHRNLTYIREAKILSSHQACWALFFNRFDFTLSYRSGSKNSKPDALSRQFDRPEVDGKPELILPSSRVVTSIQWGIETTVKRAQQQHPDPGNGPPGRFFVPNSMRSDALQWGHASLSSGHLGSTRRLKPIQRRFWWPKMQ